VKLNHYPESNPSGYNPIIASMMKPPEEGMIWEWRAFGRISKTLASKVKAHPLRLGIDKVRGEDIYLISPESDHNVKLRKSANGWVLKFKLLCHTRSKLIELYNESAEWIYRFPVTVDRLQAAARLLKCRLPKLPRSIETLTTDEFVQALGRSSPVIAETRVSKTRSQYRFDGGWLELAHVTFSKRRIHSISIHSPDRKVVKEMLARLSPGAELEPMNYLEACRRWG